MASLAKEDDSDDVPDLVESSSEEEDQGPSVASRMKAATTRGPDRAHFNAALRAHRLMVARELVRKIECGEDSD